MSRRAFEILAPFTEAERGARSAGEIPLEALGRLEGVVQSVSGAVRYSLRLTHTGAHRYRVSGTVEAALVLVCQRCLKPYTHAVVSEFDLAMVRSDAEAQRAVEVDDLEPVLITDDVLHVADLVEDELLLAVPVVPRHPAGEPCELGMASEPVPDDLGAKPNPFAVLAELKRKH